MIITKNLGIVDSIVLFKKNLASIFKKNKIKNLDNKLKKTIDYYDLNAKQYVESTFEDGFTQYQLTEFTNFLPKKAKILDIGCGSGRDAKYLYEEGHTITAIDLSKNIISEAKKRVKKVKFQQMDARDMRFKENSFDGVWCHASLYHLQKKQLRRALKQIKKTLKPNGIFYLGMKEGKGEKMTKKAFYAYYQMHELLKYVRTSGFEIIRAYSEKDNESNWLNIYAKKSSNSNV